MLQKVNFNSLKNSSCLTTLIQVNVLILVNISEGNTLSPDCWNTFTIILAVS
jgi:hypothetical protein